MLGTSKALVQKPEHANVYAFRAFFYLLLEAPWEAGFYVLRSPLSSAGCDSRTSYFLHSVVREPGLL